MRGVLFFLFVSSGCARARIRSFSARLLNELTKILISLLSFLSFARSRHINKVKKNPYEVKGEKGGGGEGAKCTGFITFDLLLETSALGQEAQAKALGISKNSLNHVWKFFGCRKLGCGMAGAIHSGEHGFDENIMERLGFNKEDHVTVLVWYALLDDKTKKKVNNTAATIKRNYEKAKQEMAENEKGEKMTKAQLRSQLQYEKATQEMVDIGGGRMVTKAQLPYEKAKQIIVENEKGEKMTKAQLRKQKRKQRNKEFVREQFICRPPGRLQKEKCSICGREKSFGWAKAPDALWYVEKLFKEKGLTEYPSFRAANGYLTMKKRKHLGKEDILLRTTDILCYACWKTCEGAAEKTMQKLLKL